MKLLQVSGLAALALICQVRLCLPTPAASCTLRPNHPSCHKPEIRDSEPSIFTTAVQTTSPPSQAVNQLGGMVVLIPSFLGILNKPKTLSGFRILILQRIMPWLEG